MEAPDAATGALVSAAGMVAKREVCTHASRFLIVYIATVRISRDHFLPPDPNAFLAAEPATGRVVVIAPTRAACETIELAMGLEIDTLLAREHGEDIRRLAASGRGFGIVAGRGTGETPPPPWLRAAH